MRRYVMPQGPPSIPRRCKQPSISDVGALRFSVADGFLYSLACATEQSKLERAGEADEAGTARAFSKLDRSGDMRQFCSASQKCVREQFRPGRKGSGLAADMDSLAFSISGRGFCVIIAREAVICAAFTLLIHQDAQSNFHSLSRSRPSSCASASDAASSPEGAVSRMFNS